MKNEISKKSLGDSDKSQRLFGLFYFERILERISKSKYNGQIILKGGLLLTSIIGDNDRTTKDMDATLKGIPLTKTDIEKIFNEILNIDVQDGVSFEIVSIKDIRLENEYGGYRLNVLSKLDNNKTYVTIELTTGDVITPREIEYGYNAIFSEQKIPIMAYTIETILAEKFQTVMERGILSTRLKDYYDIYILINNYRFDYSILKQAIQNTFKRRNFRFDIDNLEVILIELKSDENMKRMWHEYQLKNSYAKDILFEDTIAAIKSIIEIIK